MLPKRETIVWLAPTDEQILAYQKVLKNSEVIREACQKTKLGIEVFRAVGLLKRLCNHPLFVLPMPKPSDWSQFLESAKTSQEGKGDVDDSDIAVSSGDTETLGMAGSTEKDDARGGRAVEMMVRKLPRHAEALRSQSAKLRCLHSLLPSLAARNHRMLIFSHSLKMMDLIQICCLKPHGLRCLRIDGMTDPELRAEKIAKFQKQRDRFQCMLLTTTVGGVGLNLTGADRVIVVDPSWNPATDAQAVDRAFRIGQTKEVRVYRLIMSGLIEDKMFRLQVFKMGLSKLALQGDNQQRYFTEREIRALFEWTDPNEGVTRKMLIDTHGPDCEKGVEKAAHEDGSGEGWFSAGPAVGLSDIGLLYSNAPEEQEQDDDCAAQVMEAKAKLGAADEKLNQAIRARTNAEENEMGLTQELKEVNAAIETNKDKMASNTEQLKEKRGHTAQARRAEFTAKQRLEKAMRTKAKADAKEQQLMSTVVPQAADAIALSVKAVQEAFAAMRSAEDSFTTAVLAVEENLKIVDHSGRAVNDGVIDAAPETVTEMKKTMGQLSKAIDGQATRQAELEVIEEELTKATKDQNEARVAAAKASHIKDDLQSTIAKKSADLTLKNRERDFVKVEAQHTKSHQRAEATRDAMSQAIHVFAEKGGNFIASFVKAESKSVKVDQVKAVMRSANATFRQLNLTWSSVKSTREAWMKAVKICRKAEQRVASSVSLTVASEESVADAQSEYAEAVSEEESCCTCRTHCEGELGELESQRDVLELRDAELKRRRDELKAAILSSKEAVRSARFAEKEATLEKQSLHKSCSKVEKAQMVMEEAMDSAVRALKAEQYDAGQVEQAYEHANCKKRPAPED